jgi:hypothetical protein
MTSSGFAPHGEQAVERTFTLNESTPSTRRKIVETSVDSSTTTAFTGAQPSTLVRHLVVTVSVTSPTLVL